MDTSQPQSNGAGAADSNSHSKDKDAGGYGAVAASDAFSEALRTASEGLVLRLRLQNLYWLGDGFAFRRATGKVWGFVDGFVDRALAKVDSEGEGVKATGREDSGDGGDEREKKGSNKKFGLLESLLEQTRDREELIAQTLGKTPLLSQDTQLTPPPSRNASRPRHNRRPPRLVPRPPHPPPPNLLLPPLHHPRRLPQRLATNLLPTQILPPPPALPPRSPAPAPHRPRQQPLVRQRHNPAPRWRPRSKISHSNPSRAAGSF